MSSLLNAFVLGTLVAEQAHGVYRTAAHGEEMQRILKRISEGDVLLVETPEEARQSAPEPETNLSILPREEIERIQTNFANWLIGQAMRQQREIATQLLAEFPPLST